MSGIEEFLLNVFFVGEVERLGPPFYSTKESGTGLGLMVCYRIVEAANGKIHVTSEKGKGTQFSITMPLV